MTPDIQAIDDQMTAIKFDAQALASGLTEEQGVWRSAPDSWSVAQCLDHLAKTDHLYLAAMEDAAIVARIEGRLRRGPAKSGALSRWLAGSLGGRVGDLLSGGFAGPIGGSIGRWQEPPVLPRRRLKTPHVLLPRTAPPLADALGGFLSAHFEVRFFLRSFAHLDLARIRFTDPLVPAIRFSLATGLNNLMAHERRHLWQAWRVRRGALAGAKTPQTERQKLTQSQRWVSQTFPETVPASTGAQAQPGR